MSFYNNLTSGGTFFFWIGIFLAILVLILLIVLLGKNKKLKQLVEEENNDNEVLEKEIEDEVKPIPIIIETKEEKINQEVEIADNKEEKIDQKIEIIDEKKQEESKIEVEKPTIETNTPIAYQKNVLREMSRKMPTSPIHIERSEYDDDVSVYTATSRIDNEIDKINVIEDSSSPLESIEDTYEANDSMRFASEIVSRMEEEMKPSNIELNDYEKKQEEEAIISYDELQKVKDKIYNLGEEEETDEFIDELKNFRSDLR